MSATLIFLLLMVPGSFFLGLYDVLVRKTLRRGTVNEQFFLGYDFLSAAVILSIPLMIRGLPTIQPGFWSAIITTIILNIFAQWAWFVAFKKEEASLISPFRLITPPLVVLTGYLVLREQPTFGGVLGIFVTIAGLWMLLKGEATFHGQKFFTVIRRRGVLLAVLGAISFAVSLAFDKKAVVTSSAFLMVVMTGIGIGGASMLMSYLFSLRAAGAQMKLDFKDNWRTLIVLPFVHSAGTLMTAGALNYALVAYAASVKRLWSLWAVLLSGHLLKEKNIGRKLLATVVMLLGIVVTLVFG